MFTRSIRPFAVTLLIVGLCTVGVQSASAQSTTADVVYGQLGSFTTSGSNDGGITANSLFQPAGVALDTSGNLYVADTFNSRVLFYPAGSTTATRVYGQGGSFTSDTPNNGGVGPHGLYNPTGVALDSSGISTWPTKITIGCCSIPPAAPPPRGSTGSWAAHLQHPEQRRDQRQRLRQSVGSRPGQQRQSLRGRLR